MLVAEQVQHLKALGLPHSSAARRKASWEIYQAASAWFAYQPGLAPLQVDGIPGPKTTTDVRHAAANGYRIAPHFKLQEFACTCGVAKVDRDLVVALEKIRAKLYPKGLSIVSGYRCVARNRAVGGVWNSAHLLGKAADIPRAAQPSAFKGMGLRGIGYKAAHGLVTHVDVDNRLRKDHVFKEN